MYVCHSAMHKLPFLIKSLSTQILCQLPLERDVTLVLANSTLLKAQGKLEFKLSVFWYQKNSNFMYVFFSPLHISHECFEDLPTWRLVFLSIFNSVRSFYHLLQDNTVFCIFSLSTWPGSVSGTLCHCLAVPSLNTSLTVEVDKPQLMGQLNPATCLCK